MHHYKIAFHQNHVISTILLKLHRFKDLKIIGCQCMKLGCNIAIFKSFIFIRTLTRLYSWLHVVYVNEKISYFILYWSLYYRYINSLHHTHWVKHQCNRVSKRDNWYSPTRFSFPLPTDRFANMTRSRVWQKSLFSSNSSSGCDNVFGDDPKPMHQSCWLVDRKAFSVLHVSHFEF